MSLHQVTTCLLRTRRFVLPLLFLLGTVAYAAAQTKAPPLNIVLIYADDLGYGDLGSYGATQFQTPHLDRLAADGMRFTNFEVAQAVCSASRAAMLTGCYPNRVSISGALNPHTTTGLNPAERPLPNW